MPMPKVITAEFGETIMGCFQSHDLGSMIDPFQSRINPTLACGFLFVDIVCPGLINETSTNQNG